MKKFFLAALATVLLASQSQACNLFGLFGCCQQPQQTRQVYYSQPVCQQSPAPTTIYYTVQPACTNGTCQPVTQTINTIRNTAYYLTPTCPNGNCPRR